LEETGLKEKRGFEKTLFRRGMSARTHFSLKKIFVQGVKGSCLLLKKNNFLWESQWGKVLQELVNHS